MPDTSPCPTPRPTQGALIRPGARDGSASFGDLLHRAGDHLLDARQQCATLPGEEPAVREAVAAHRDITSALARLGRVLADPQPRQGRRRDRSTAAADPVRAVAELEQLGAPHPWDRAVPGTHPAVELHAAARAVRAAADLWATHHDPADAPRGPESSRVRHPAFLGAAGRAWQGLVNASALVADQLSDLVASHDLDPALARGVRGYPRVPGVPLPDEAGSDAARLGIRVARPGVRTQMGPLAELADRLLAVRHLAWTMARTGSAPVVVLSNMAAIGDSLARAATASTTPSPRVPARVPRALTGTAPNPGAGWPAVAQIVSTLRSPHPVRHRIQVERMTIERLLERITTRRSALPRAEVAAALAHAVQLYSQVAAFNQEALRKAYARGDVYILGSAIPGNAVARSGDALLDLKLSGAITPAPSFTIRRLERAYRSVASGPNPVTGGPRAA